MHNPLRPLHPLQEELQPWAASHPLCPTPPSTVAATPASPFSPLQLHSQTSTARSAFQGLQGSVASCHSESGSVSSSSWLLPHWADVQGSSPEQSPRLGSSPQGIDWCGVLASQQRSSPASAASALPSSRSAAGGGSGCPTALLAGGSAQAQALALDLLLLAAAGSSQNHGIALPADTACPTAAASPSVPPQLQPPHPLLPLRCSGMQAAQQAALLQAGIVDMLQKQQLLAACQLLQQGLWQGEQQQQHSALSWPGQPCSDLQHPCQQIQQQQAYDRSSTSTSTSSQTTAKTSDLDGPRRFSRRNLPPLPCPPSRKLFVGHLNADVDEEVLGSLFASCGEVLCAKVSWRRLAR
jgi:hypothetical protein